MIVDDNAQIRKVIRSVLEDSADAFCDCGDGDDALQAYEQFRPDWVLIDIGMNRMDGITATEQIKNRYPDAKVIVVTEYGDNFFKDAARKAGAIDFVLKEHLSDILEIVDKTRRGG
ncbi:MAG TPA: response regulator [Terriglobia bacterium]|nr:response regulator [Terriglobia bacterium]